MNINKTLLAGLASGVAYFFLGWLVYGMLLQNVMTPPSEEITKVITKEPMGMWTMLVSCLAYGGLLAYIYGRWANISTFKTGAIAGAVIGAFTAAWIDLSMLSMYTFITAENSIIDIIAHSVISAILGGIAGWVLGTGKKTA